MITAEEARNISMDTTEKHLEFISTKIKKSASQGRSCVVIDEKPCSLWLKNKSSGKSDSVRDEVIEKLAKNGYTVKQYEKSFSFKTYSGLEISW